MMRRLILLAAAALLAMPATAQAAEAVEAVTTPVAYVLQDRGRAEGRLSLSEVVSMLRRSGRQGAMIDANQGVRGGRAVYVVIWQYPGGRIGNIYVDQRTGAVLGED